MGALFEKRTFVPMTFRWRGHDFVYDGGDTVIEDHGEPNVISIPDWVNLVMIDDEAFQMICLTWLWRQGVISL